MSTTTRLTKEPPSRFMGVSNRMSRPLGLKKNTARTRPPFPSAPLPRPRKKSLAAALLLCLITTAAFSNTPNPTPTQRGQWTVVVKGMSCPLCANNIEKQIRRVIPDATVKIDLGTGSVEVRSNSSPLDAALKIRRAVISAGFTPGEVSPAQ